MSPRRVVLTCRNLLSTPPSNTNKHKQLYQNCGILFLTPWVLAWRDCVPRGCPTNKFLLRRGVVEETVPSLIKADARPATCPVSAYDATVTYLVTKANYLYFFLSI